MKETQEYRIIDTDTKVIAISENYSRAYSKIEFESNLSGHDMVFYYIDQIKDKNKWKVISLKEIDPSEELSLFMKRAKIKISKSDSEEIIALFQNFTEEMKKDYKTGENYLISKAKKSHVSSYSFQTKAIETNIEDIEIDSVMYSSKKVAVVKVTYSNNSKPMAVLLGLYKTSKGWKIYDIKQI